MVDHDFNDDHSLHAILDEVILLASDRIALKNVKVIRDYVSEDCIVGLTNIVVNAIESMDPTRGECRNRRAVPVGLRHVLHAHVQKAVEHDKKTPK